MDVGLDTYGRVKSVGGTPIVTRFFMVSSFPVYPLESYYFSRTDSEGVDSTPRLGFSLPITGIPLARIDRASVCIAYVRGICAALVVLGFIGSIFMIIPLLMGPHGMAVDPVKTLYASLCVLAIGIVGGASTYFVRLTSDRELRIRMYSGELLGFCADPAKVRADLAVEMWRQLHATTVEPISEQATPRLRCLLQLLEVRCRIAEGERVEEMEQMTDQLLTRLRQWDDE